MVKLLSKFLIHNKILMFFFFFFFFVHTRTNLFIEYAYNLSWLNSMYGRLSQMIVEFCSSGEFPSEQNSFFPLWVVT